MVQKEQEVTRLKVQPQRLDGLCGEKMRE